MTIRKTITLTDQQDQWIKAQIDVGQFTNDSEYIRDLVRRDQERNAEIHAIREKLIRAEQSGLSERTPQQIRAEAKAKLTENV
jgi:antitoxin ParD1/3/4